LVGIGVDSIDFLNQSSNTPMWIVSFRPIFRSIDQPIQRNIGSFSASLLRACR
jgi:hypothetical protein